MITRRITKRISDVGRQLLISCSLFLLPNFLHAIALIRLVMRNWANPLPFCIGIRLQSFYEFSPHLREVKCEALRSLSV